MSLVPPTKYPFLPHTDRQTLQILFVDYWKSIIHAVHVSFSGLYCSHGNTCGCVTNAGEPPGQTFWEHQRDLEIQQVSKHARPCVLHVLSREAWPLFFPSTIIIELVDSIRMDGIDTQYTVYCLKFGITNFSAPLCPNSLNILCF